MSYIWSQSQSYPVIEELANRLNAPEACAAIRTSLGALRPGLIFCGVSANVDCGKRASCGQGSDRSVWGYVFPAGSITGAPKVRAMEIIDELEPTRRGVYTDSIGCLGFDSCMDLNSVIRTFVIKDGRASF